MSASDAASVIHPSPARKKVSLAALLFGLAGAPFAWAGQLLAGIVVAMRLCGPWGAAEIRAASLWISAGAVAIALAALGASWRSWRATQEEGGHIQPQEGFGHQHAAQVGEGRARFMAMGGLLMSTMFLAAVLFSLSVAAFGARCAH